MTEQPYTKLDPKEYQRVSRVVKCPDCKEVYLTDLPGPMCPFCNVYCITLMKPIVT